MTPELDWTSAIEHISQGSPKLVMIEGAESVGKTPFAKRLARELRGLSLSTDSFIRSTGNPKSTYPEMVDQAALMAAINSAAPPVVVEGICLREFIPAEALERAVLVYIRRVQSDGSWLLAEKIAAFDESDFVLCIEDEVLRYHRAFAPHNDCALLVSLVEGDRPE